MMELVWIRNPSSVQFSVLRRQPVLTRRLARLGVHRRLQYHYNVGYGNDISGIIGFPWVNATLDLLLAQRGPPTYRTLYVIFTHRELPPTVLVAMGLFNNLGLRRQCSDYQRHDASGED